MRRILTLSLVAPCLVALALAACQKGGGAGGGPDGQMSAPARKAGLWEQAILADGQPRGPAIRMCYDAATDQKRPVFGRRFRRGACDKYSITRGADGSYVSDTVCQMGSGAKVTSHTVVSGDFNNKYVVHSDRTVEGAPDEDFNGHHTTVVTASYIGPCPAGMAPGQVQINGQIMDAPTRGAFGPGGGGGGGGDNAAPDSGGNQTAQ